MSVESFSRRNGYNPKIPEISVREAAPAELRIEVIELINDCMLNELDSHYMDEYCLTPVRLNELIYKTLKKRPEKMPEFAQFNQFEYPPSDDNDEFIVEYSDAYIKWLEEINQKNHNLIKKCEWYKVYDIIEAILAWYIKLFNDNVTDRVPDYIIETFWSGLSERVENYKNKLNEYFIANGIGWQIKDGYVKSRGDEEYENILQEAEKTLSKADKKTAANELREARSDISRRPSPDVTGAIHHSMASLECVSREICGEPKATLGKILKENKDLIPTPLDIAVDKAWGYASNMGRHLREGCEPSYEEAELIVGISASVSSYLIKKQNKNNTSQ